MKSFTRALLERVAGEAVALAQLAEHGANVEGELEKLLERECEVLAAHELALVNAAASYGENVCEEQRAESWRENLMNPRFRIGDTVVVIASEADLEETGANCGAKDRGYEVGYASGEVFKVGHAEFDLDGRWLVAKSWKSLLLNEGQIEKKS